MDPTDPDPQRCVGPRLFVTDPISRWVFKWAKHLLNKLFSLGSVKDSDANYFIIVSTIQKISFNSFCNIHIFFSMAQKCSRRIRHCKEYLQIRNSLLIEKFVFRIFTELNTVKNFYFLS
jgi:hypothetical protein